MLLARKIRRRIYKYLLLTGTFAPIRRNGLDFGSIQKSLSLNIDCSLDIGSGPIPRNPFNAPHLFGCDIRAHSFSHPSISYCRLGYDPLPFESASMHILTAYDVLEHIPRVDSSSLVTPDIDASRAFPFVYLLNEIFRVLKPEGLFYSETPCYPLMEAFQDPTHVNIMTEDTLTLYFTGALWASIYGFVGSFSKVADCWKGPKYCCLLQKQSRFARHSLSDTHFEH